MIKMLALKRDYYAGALMVLIGLFAVTVGRTYAIGSLAAMGPGFFPVALGAGMIIVGLLIAAAAHSSEEPDVGERLGLPDLRGSIAIILAIILFVVSAERLGMIFATFGCVFVAALGDHASTLKSALALAAGITALGVVLFYYILQVNIPLVPW